MKKKVPKFLLAAAYKVLRSAVGPKEVAQLIRRLLDIPEVAYAFALVDRQAELVNAIIPYLSVAMAMQQGLDTTWVHTVRGAASMAGRLGDLPEDDQALNAFAEHVYRVCDPRKLIVEYLAEKEKTSAVA